MQASWQPPPEEFVKINVDGAFEARSGQGGWGIICRDSASDIRFLAAGAASDLTDALHAETTALCNAVQLADQLGVGRVLFKTDSLMLKQAVVSNLYDFAPL